MSFPLEISMVQIICTCGIPFSMPERFERQKREDGKDFYCPSGHTLAYNNSPLKKAETALATEKGATKALAAEVNRLKKKLDAAKVKSTAPPKAQVLPKATPPTSAERVMKALKEHSDKTAKELATLMGERQRNTVASTLSVLAREGKIHREKDSTRTYRYRLLKCEVK